MPEIKNQLKKETLQAPVHDKLLDLPQRRSPWKFVLIPIVVILILVGAAFTFLKFYKPDTDPVSVNNVPEMEEQKIPEGTNFYLLANTNTEGFAKLYRYSSNSAEPDQLIAKLGQKEVTVLGNWTEPYKYVIRTGENKVAVLNAATGDIQNLFDIPKDNTVGGVALSSDKKLLAYGLNQDAAEKRKPTGEIWLFNLETKESKLLVKKVDMRLYEGFSVLGWRDNDKEIIVQSLGGDGPALWGNIYEVNSQTGEFVIVQYSDEVNFPQFVTGRLSPDGEKWLYSFCAQPDEEVRKQEGGYEKACASGAELRTYDFASKQIKTVYQNLRFNDNVDKSMLRTFMSFVWQDNKTVIAAVPGAMLSIDTLSTKDNVTEILQYDGSVPQEFRNHYISIISATSGQVIYTRNESSVVFDRVSHKLVNVLSPDTSGYIYSWLD